MKPRKPLNPGDKITYAQTFRAESRVSVIHSPWVEVEKQLGELIHLVNGGLIPRRWVTKIKRKRRSPIVGWVVLWGPELCTRQIFWREPDALVFQKGVKGKSRIAVLVEGGL